MAGESSGVARGRPWLGAAWRGALAGAALGAAAAWLWALLGARRDGYFTPRLLELAANALARRLATGRLEAATAALALLGAIVAAATAGRPRPLRLALRTALLAPAAWLAATGHFVAEDEVTPPLAGLGGVAANGALLALLVAVAAALFHLVTRVAAPAAVAAGLAPWLVAVVVALADQKDIVAAAGPQRSVALVSLDTLRADRLGCNGHARDTTPALDAFAAGAVRFADVSAPFPFTLTSHATLFTGLDPAAHGATLLGQRVDERQPPFSDVPLLAEAFRDAGWLTIGLVDTCLWLQPQYGLARGFDLWRNVPGDAARKCEELERVLRDLRGRPAFLFLHCFDAHSDNRALPYDRDPEDAGRYTAWHAGGFDGSDPAFPGAAASKLLRAWNDAAAPLPDELVRLVSDLYDEGVRSTDRKAGRALELLREAGFFGEGVVAVTSDHGEEFREHGRFLHDTQLYRESVQVPLLLRLPHGSSGGRVVTTPVGLLDVAPTLAELAGVALPPVQGRSLLACIDAPDDEALALFLGAEPGEEAVRLGRFKLLREGGTSRLFDLAEDPGESRDVAAENPEIVRALELRLDARRAENEALAASRSRAGGLALDPDDVRRMQAIGYGGN